MEDDEAVGEIPRSCMSVRERRRELGELLADHAHLFAVVLVRRDATYFLANRRTNASPGCGRLQCRSRSVEANMERARHTLTVAHIVLQPE
ncbi:MAG TPA: hypothetical protein VF101_01565 [Gaiellaceae bacterium]